MIDFIIENKQWLLSGIGVAVLTAIVKIFVNLKRKGNTSVNNDNKRIRGDVNISGNASGGISSNIAGGNIIYVNENNKSIEQYRGNLISKFIQFYEEIEKVIENLQEQKKDFHCSELIEDEMQYFHNLYDYAKKIEKRIYKALDSNNIVTAHENLNKLKERGLQIREEYEHHWRIVEKCARMDISAGTTHYIRATNRQTALSIISHFDDIEIKDFHAQNSTN